MKIEITNSKNNFSIPIFNYKSIIDSYYKLKELIKNKDPKRRNFLIHMRVMITPISFINIIVYTFKKELTTLNNYISFINFICKFIKHCKDNFELSIDHRSTVLYLIKANYSSSFYNLYKDSIRIVKVHIFNNRDRDNCFDVNYLEWMLSRIALIPKKKTKKRIKLYKSILKKIKSLKLSLIKIIKNGNKFI